jgi:hypothetical protein
VKKVLPETLPGTKRSAVGGGHGGGGAWGLGGVGALDAWGLGTLWTL